MKQGQEFLFIEVKTRRENNSVTQPFDLSEEKIEKCHSAMQEYAAALKIEEWRAELVGVTIMENGLAKITTAPL
jgi:Holliday junction resolvase-like predicted endonuclease